MRAHKFLKMILVLIGVLVIFNAQGQTIQPCPFGSAFESQIVADSNYQNSMQARFSFLHDPNPNQNTIQSFGPLVVPVVIHIIHLPSESVGQGLNISYAQVESQISRLNADFANDTVYTQLPSGVWAANAGIQFCLAKNPMGPSAWTNSSEPGVMRYPVTSATIYNQICDYNNQSTVNAMLAITHPNTNYFPFDRYLNIWTVNQITDGASAHFGGYSPLPLLNAAFPLDGIVMDVHMFGDNTVNNNNFPNINPQYNTGNILTHETGHYLSLFHTFTGGCAGMLNSNCTTSGDFICDTPPNTNTSGSCNASDGCNESSLVPWGNRPDMIENYMTWSDDNCLNTFTSEQGTVMRNYLTYFRSTLVQDTNLALTGVAGVNSCIPPILSAEFISPNSICINQNAAFQGYSGPGFANHLFQWSFVNATPSTSTIQNPVVVFTASGAQLVSLTVTDTLSNTTATHSFYVYVSPCSALQSYMGNWYFGKRAGVSFATGTAQTDNAAFLNSTIRSVECSVSLSDSAGLLIFYSDGDTIWDRNHYPAITNLVPDTSDSKTQIIYSPHPLHSNWYYLFHSPAYEQGVNPLRYSLFADSLGTIIPIQLNDTAARPPGMGNSAGYAEHITAIPHCNGRDTWIITTGRATTSSTFYYGQCLYVFLVSPAGVTNPDGISPYPRVYWMANSNIQLYYAPWGSMKASVDGTKIAFTGSGGAYMASFDPATGMLSNDQFIPASSTSKYGLSFSPDGNSLYISEQTNHLIEGADLTVLNPSFTTVATGTTWRGGLQMGPDSTIYCIHDGNINVGVTLDRLNNPNNLSNPGYVAAAVTVNNTYGQIRTGFGLPNFIEAKRPSTTPLAFTTTMTSCTTVAFNFPGCWHTAYNFLWNFGDNSTDTIQSPTHNYAAPGTYTVTLTVSIGSFAYQISQPVTIINSAPQITGPASFCSNSISQVQYVIPTGFSSYLWTITGSGNIIGTNTNNYVDVTWAGNGTISCVVNNGPNCQFNVSLPVSYFNSPIVNAGADTITSCLNSIVNLGGSPTANLGGPPYTYLWTPAVGLSNATVANPLCTLATSMTYTVLVTDNNGCTGSDVVYVNVDTVNVAPIVTFDYYAQRICDFSNTLDLSPYVTPAGGVFSGTGITGSNFDASAAGGQGSYFISYIVTAANGCNGFASDTIEVIECCQSPASGITTLDQESSLLYGSSFNSTAVPVRINGQFFVNNNFTISNYSGTNDVQCAPDAEIVIKANGKLTIDFASDLHACSNGMWKGITIEPGGELIILSNSKVRDAKQAVVSQGGAKYTLDHAILRDNYQNLVVDSFQNQGLHPGTIVRSTVLGATLTLPPYSGIKTYSCIEIGNVDSIRVGLPGSVADENRFTGAEFGIIVDSSEVYAYNNLFNSIQHNALILLPSCCINSSCQDMSVCFPPPKGTAIWAVGSKVHIGESNVNYQNRFRDCTKGILCERDCKGYINGNQFDIITGSNFVESYCMKITNCRGDSLHIQYNVMDNIKNGIQFTFNTNCTSRMQWNKINNYSADAIKILQTKECPVYIIGNSLNVTSNTGGQTAIKVQNAVLTNNTRYIFIQSNVSYRTNRHIWVVNAQYVTIDSTNNINFPAATPSTIRYGVQVQNGANSLIKDNILIKAPPAPVSDTMLREKLYGISMNVNCYNSEIASNGLIRVGTGIQFAGSNNFPSAVTCNNLNNNMAGVRMNNSYIGDQGAPVSSQNPNGIAHDNTFTFQSGQQKTFYRNQTDIPFNWYCRTTTSGSPTTNPTQFSMQPSGAMFMFSAFPNAADCGANNANNNQQQQLVQIVSRISPFDSLSAEEIYMADQTVIQQLNAKPELMAQGTPEDSILLAFFNQALGSNLGTLDDAQRLATAGDLKNAAIKISSVWPANCIESAQKTVYDIYLRSWALGLEYFSPGDSIKLMEIAHQNAFECGTAVYDARVMLGLEIDDLESMEGRLPGNEAPAFTNALIYPNPASADAVYQIELLANQSAILVVYDLVGQPVFSAQLSEGLNTIHIPCSRFANGVYIYSVIANGIKLDTGKLAVTH